MSKSVGKLPTKRQKQILLRVLAYIKQEPDRLNMKDWGTIHPNACPLSGALYDWEYETANREFETGKYKVGSKLLPIPPCNTTACLAGTVLLVTKAGKKLIKEELEYEDVNIEKNIRVVSFPMDTDDRAAEILKLTEEQAGNLFYFKSWGSTAASDTEKDKYGDPKYVKVGWDQKHATAYNKAKNGKERYKALEARVLDFFKTGK